MPPTGCVPFGHPSASIGLTANTTSKPSNDSFFILSSVTITMRDGTKISLNPHIASIALMINIETTAC